MHQGYLDEEGLDLAVHAAAIAGCLRESLENVGMFDQSELNFNVWEC